MDTDDTAKLAQLSELERLLKARKLGKDAFCAILWGDLNNRLVAFNELSEHVMIENGKSSDGNAKPVKSKTLLKDSGIKLLASMIDDPERRKELLSKDVLLFEGKDLKGNEFVTAECNDLLRKLFTLHVDAVKDGRLPVPLPSYKRSPLDELLSLRLTFPVRFGDMICTGKIDSSRQLDPPEANSRFAYFGWEGNKPKPRLSQRYICREPSSADDAGGPGPACLQLGWREGVGICKEECKEIAARLVAWETEVGVHAFDNLPMRAVVEVRATGARDLPR